MKDGELQYTGFGLSGFNGGIINKGGTVEGFWTYRYTPVPGTGAGLDEKGLPQRVGEYRVTGTYNNGRYSAGRTSNLKVTPAPLTVLIAFEDENKVYDGTSGISIKTASLSGILADDNVEISVMGKASYLSPNAGKDIEIIFTDFEISGEHARNYYLIQPKDYVAGITRAGYSGSVSVVINDDPLRINSELTFTASGNPSDYLVQWRVDDEDIDGANDVTYIVKPDDVDKQIKVALISPCRNYEGESPPTSYVPYTIKLLTSNSTVPMENDYVFFGTHGNYIAYAASKNNGYVSIDYLLQDSGFGTDTIKYSGGNVPDVSDAGTGKSRYYANPDDALNGVITLRTAFYHRGISVSPGGLYTFESIICGFESDEVLRVTVSQLGNAPTGPISIEKSGPYPDEFKTSSSYIPGLGIGESYELDITVNKGLSPPDFSGYYLAALISITGEYFQKHSIPVSLRVDHDFPPLIYRGGHHDHTCSGCGFHNSADCTYSIWDDHSRTCSICTGVSSHMPEWSAWAHGTATQHTRSCTLCALTNNANHTWSGWSAWANTNASNHTRSRSCTTCSRPASESAAHSFGGWSYQNNTNHSRRCSGCGRSETGNHTWEVYSQHRNHSVNPVPVSGQHQRWCRVCNGTSLEACAPWGQTDWGPGIGQCARLCRGCLHTVAATAHTWSGGSCTRCGATTP